MSGSSHRYGVGVVGAGTMGAGIAQVAATAGHPVMVFDTAPGMVDRAIADLELGSTPPSQRGGSTGRPPTTSPGG